MKTVIFMFDDGVMVKDPFNVDCIIKESSTRDGATQYWVTYDSPNRKDKWWPEGSLSNHPDHPVALAGQVPTVGDIVLYYPNKDEIKLMQNDDECNEAHVLPAIITAVWSENCINVRVIHDGILADFWKTSILRADPINVVPDTWAFR